MRLIPLVAACLGISLGADFALAAASGNQLFTDRDLVARFHFVGLEKIATDDTATNLVSMAALPEMARFKEQTLQKLSTAPYRYLQDHVSGTNDFAQKLRSLMDDLLRAESCVEVRGPTNEVPELMLAIRLDNDRAALWRNNLSAVLTAWTGLPVKEIKGEGYDGWELQKHHQPNLIRFLRTGDWVLLGWGQDGVRSQAGMLQRIKDHKLPVEAQSGAWLDLQADWSRLTANPPALGPFKLSAIHLTVEGRKDEAQRYYVRPQLIMRFAEPLGLTLKPWRIPTNGIRSPIGSFTAVRGVVSRLNDVPLVKTLGAAPLPDQLYVWAENSFPFEMCVAAPVPAASNYLEQIQPGLVSTFNSKWAPHVGTITASWTTNRRIIITGFPLLGPYLGVVHDTNGDYVAGATFPSPKRNQPVPPELVSNLTADPRLVLYSWELTGPRLAQWDQFFQVLFVAYGIHVPMEDAAGTWVQAIGPKLGNCGTEVTLTGPNELTLLRNSPLGLSSVELFWLAHWMDAPEFPLGNYGETARWRPSLGAPSRHP